jgi:hypothetical protein
MPYDQAKKLQALAEYLEAIGVSDIKELPHGSGQPPLQEQGLSVASAMTHFWAFKNGEQIGEFAPTESIPMSATELSIFDSDYKPPTWASVKPPSSHTGPKLPKKKKKGKKGKISGSNAEIFEVSRKKSAAAEMSNR